MFNIKKCRLFLSLLLLNLSINASLPTSTTQASWHKKFCKGAAAGAGAVAAYFLYHAINSYRHFSMLQNERDTDLHAFNQRHYGNKELHLSKGVAQYCFGVGTAFAGVSALLYYTGTRSK